MKKKTIRVVGLLLLLCVLAVAFIGYRLYNKPHRSAATENTVAVTAGQLVAAYEKDEPAANRQFLGKALRVSGTVSGLSVNQQQKQVIMLSGSGMGGVQCSLLENTALKKGDAVYVSGFCSGFLTDVIMDRCIVAR